MAAVVAAVVLGGCSDDPTPEFEADPTPAPSASSTPAELEPWEEKSDEGAIAFVKHWLNVFRAAENTGDTAELLRLSATECESCRNFIEEIDRVYAAGGRMTSDGWTVISSGEPLSRSRGRISIPFEVRQSDQTVQQSQGSEPVVNKGIELGLAASLAWRGGWTLTRLDIVR